MDTKLEENFFISDNHGLMVGFRGERNGRIYSNGIDVPYLRDDYIKQAIHDLKKTLQYKILMGIIPEDVYDKIEERKKLRVAGKFNESDKIRKDLEDNSGVLIEDRKDEKVTIKIREPNGCLSGYWRM